MSQILQALFQDEDVSAITDMNGFSHVKHDPLPRLQYQSTRLWGAGSCFPKEGAGRTSPFSFRLQQVDVYMYIYFGLGTGFGKEEATRLSHLVLIPTGSRD